MLGTPYSEGSSGYLPRVLQLLGPHKFQVSCWWIFGGYSGSLGLSLGGGFHIWGVHGRPMRKPLQYLPGVMDRLLATQYLDHGINPVNVCMYIYIYIGLTLNPKPIYTYECMYVCMYVCIYPETWGSVCGVPVTRIVTCWGVYVFSPLWKLPSVPLPCCVGRSIPAPPGVGLRVSALKL